MTATLSPVPELQVYWKTHGKTFSEYSDARQNIVGIVGSNDSLAPEKAAKLIRKSGKTFSESASSRELDWFRHHSAARHWRRRQTSWFAVPVGAKRPTIRAASDP